MILGLVLAAPRAQNDAPVVLPAGAVLATAEGNDHQLEMFGCESGQFRFQQIDGDLRTAQSFTNLAFRRDGYDEFPTAFPRAAEIQIFMGEGTHNAFTATFDNNYRPFTRSEVYARSFISLPDVRTPPVNPPAAFMPPIPFNRPFAFRADGDLVWEIRVRTTVPHRTEYPLDAHTAVPEQLLLHQYGIGCVANQTQPVLPMSLSSTGITYSDQRRIDLSFYLDRGPAFQIPVLAWGLREQQLDIPGLCTNLYVDPMLYTPMPLTNDCGTSTLVVPVPYVDSMAGQQVCHQVLAEDPAQPFAIPVAGSNGTSVEVVAPLPRVKSINAPTADMVTAPSGIDHGFGVVVQLDNGG